MLGVELRPRVVDHVVGLRRESDLEDAGRDLVIAQGAEDIDGRDQNERERGGTFLELVRSCLTRMPVGDCGRHDEDARSRERASHCRIHLVSGRDNAHCQAWLCRRQDAGGHQRDLGTLTDCRRGQLIAHLAA